MLYKVLLTFKSVNYSNKRTSCGDGFSIFAISKNDFAIVFNFGVSCDSNSAFRQFQARHFHNYFTTQSVYSRTFFISAG